MRPLKTLEWKLQQENNIIYTQPRQLSLSWPEGLVFLRCPSLRATNHLLGRVASSSPSPHPTPLHPTPRKHLHCRSLQEGSLPDADTMEAQSERASQPAKRTIEIEGGTLLVFQRPRATRRGMGRWVGWWCRQIASPLLCLGRSFLLQQQPHARSCGKHPGFFFFLLQCNHLACNQV